MSARGVGLNGNRVPSESTAVFIRQVCFFSPILQCGVFEQFNIVTKHHSHELEQVINSRKQPGVASNPSKVEGSRVVHLSPDLVLPNLVERCGRRDAIPTSFSDTLPFCEGRIEISGLHLEWSEDVLV